MPRQVVVAQRPEVLWQMEVPQAAGIPRRYHLQAWRRSRLSQYLLRLDITLSEINPYPLQRLYGTFDATRFFAIT